MPAGILESMALKDRAGDALTPDVVYGRRVSTETDEASAALVAYQVAREVFDVAWSATLHAAMPKVSTVEKDGLAFKLDSWTRRDQRTIRIFLGAAL